MSSSLYSESWYRVELLKPRLRSHAQIHRHSYRGVDWYVLQDHSSGRFHRFSPEAYLIIGLMNGQKTLGEIWETACLRLGDDMPTQDEVIGLVSQLHRADVLQSDIPPDTADLLKRYKLGQRRRWMSRLGSPMALRFPLIDPDRFLNRTVFLVRPLFGWAGAALWCAVVLLGLILVGIHWNELTSNLTDRVLAMENLFLLWLIYPVVKAFHEFGHAYAVKHWEGEVHEMGIMLLVLMPVPFVDASSSSAFRDKRRRMLVGAAGILVELFLASLAMFVWVNAEPGAVRAVAFNVMLIAGVSTVLFNGNPLLRFDAYYILADYLEIPNLGSRGNRYVGYLLKRYLLGFTEAQSPASAPGESGWLVSYAVASFVYRIVISVRIALFVAGKFFVVGVLLAAWSVFVMLILPLFKVLHHLFTDPVMGQRRNRILVTCLAGSAVLAVMILAVPLPSSTVVQGVIWAPEKSRVHGATDGFVARVLVEPGHTVHLGEPLVLCENYELASRVKELEAELREMEARHRLSVLRDRTEAEILKDEISRVKAELIRAREQKDELVIRSPNNGIFLLPSAEDLPGRFIRRGMPLAYVLDYQDVTVRVLVPQAEVDLVRNNTRRVEARLAESVWKAVPSVVTRYSPEASKEMPSLALSLEGGGCIALDPRESEEPKAFEKLFHFEISLPGVAVKRIGERVFVRFLHHPESLASRWYRSIRRLLLSRFDI